jgi:hypothetical protein
MSDAVRSQVSAEAFAVLRAWSSKGVDEDALLVESDQHPKLDV